MYQVYLKLNILCCIVFLEEIYIYISLIISYPRVLCYSMCQYKLGHLCHLTASAFVSALIVVRRIICFIIFIKKKFSFYTVKLYYKIFKIGSVTIFDTTIP